MSTFPIQAQHAPTYCNFCNRESHVGASCQTLPLPPFCLTLLPPWPQAILYAGKRLENRSAGVAAQIGGYRNLVGLTQSKSYSREWRESDALQAWSEICAGNPRLREHRTNIGWDFTAGKLFIVAELIRIDRPHEARGNPWHVPGQHGLIFGKVWEVEPITVTGAKGAWRPAKWCTKCGHVLAAGARGAPKAACEHVWIESWPRPRLRGVREVFTVKHMSLFDPRYRSESNMELFEDEPPEYIPAKPERHAVGRIPDLCPDDEYTGPYSSRAREELEIEAREDARRHAEREFPEMHGKLEVFNEQGHLMRSWGATERIHVAQCERLAESVPGIQAYRRVVSVWRGQANPEVFREWPAEPHNPETCREPACDCMPF